MITPIETELQPQYVLGISAFYGSSAAALLRDGKLIAAAQEERFTRIRRDASFPTSAINWCLHSAGITLDDVAHVTFYDKPLLNFGRLLETYKAIAPSGFKSFINTTTGWLSEKLFQKRLLIKELSRVTPNFPSSKLLFAQHNLSHAAGAFYPSPYEKAVVLILDGIGEWTTTTIAIGTPEKLEIIRELNFPHSLGLLYSAFTAYCGYKTGGGEYTMMHLALHGKPIYADLIRSNLIHVKPDGSYRLNSDYFNFTSGSSVTNSRFDKLFGGPSLKPGAEPTQREMNIAASIQLVTEEIVLRITRSLAKEFPDIPNLCLAGEVALNSSINTKLLRDKDGFENVWIQPAASDSGGAIGAAYCAWHQHMGMPLSAKPGHEQDLMHGAFLGPSYTSDQVADVFDRIGAIYRPIKNEQEILDRSVEALSEGKIIGWFQGRAEFGTRALGSRSILGDPRNPQTHNLALKSRFRPSYRTLAASVAKENAVQWFDTNNSPYMLFTSPIQKKLLKNVQPRKTLPAAENVDAVRGSLPAITNVDHTARLQTVHAETNRRFHALLKEFEHKTGFPILANTAFCSNNEPLVNTPEDAFHCFMSTDLDMMVIENHVLYKEEQNPALLPKYQTRLARK